MERLTKKNDSGGYYYPKCFEKCNGLGASSECDDCEIMTSVCEKLGDYEDLDEQGRLIKLPCKIGDTVWDNDFGYPCSYTITAFSFGECESYVEPLDAKEIVFYFSNSFGDITGSFLVSAIGESVFFSREEAEAKLKELRGGENESSN